MFFKKAFFLFALFPLAGHSALMDFFSNESCSEVAFTEAKDESEFFSGFTCFQDMRRDYPLLLTGELKWEGPGERQGQKRFFTCLRDSLELFVEKEIFTHDPGRDYFTKTEIFKMFHWYFEYDCPRSRRLANQVFAVKKILIGGKADQLKDEEIADFYRLVYDYRDIYYILHRQIPVFKKIFSEEPGGISPEQMSKVLEQLRKAFKLLGAAYKREGIVYPLDDLDKYDKYLKEAGLAELSSSKELKRGFLLLQNLFEGLLWPEKAIEGKSWAIALRSFRSAIKLLLYYKTYFAPDMAYPEMAYRSLESAEIFISAMGLSGDPAEGNKRGFPLRNLDGILSVFLSFLEERRSPNSFFAKAGKGPAIPLFTRTLNGFSLERSSKKGLSKWGETSGSPTVKVSFEDMRFEIFPDRARAVPLASKTVFMERDKFAFLRGWLADYKDSLLDIYYNGPAEAASHRRFEQWLDPFFGWGADSRIKFGSFRSSGNGGKAYQLLNYQAFLSLLLASYAPEGFFFAGAEAPSMSFEDWRRAVRDISPALAGLGGAKGYKPSWRKSFYELFDFADSFVISSNRNSLLEANELADLTAHFLEGAKSAKLAESKIPFACRSASCLAKALLEDRDIMSVYPRFQKYLFDSQRGKYEERIASILEGKEGGGPFRLLPFFVLMQAIELNYHLIDKDSSFKLEDSELALLAKNFEDQLARQNPYLSGPAQARSYLMYSFKTGNMPFFTGEIWSPLEFVSWHLDPESREPFSMSPDSFRFLALDFYKLYQKI